MANVPQGLPATVTSLQLIVAKKLATQKVFVKRLDAVETLGAITLICSDKTGTLTMNKMTVVDGWVNCEVGLHFFFQPSTAQGHCDLVFQLFQLSVF